MIVLTDVKRDYQASWWAIAIIEETDYCGEGRTPVEAPLDLPGSADKTLEETTQ
jgi:hypothetical protein